MNKRIAFVALALLMAACSPKAAPAPLIATWTPAVSTAVFDPSQTAYSTPATADTPTPEPSAGPTKTPAPVIDPLTGLTAPEKNLERRPLIVKVENLPRNHRPQYGLSKADLVYEYYTEEGTTRFAAIFYGQDAKKVAPIRSARFFDMNLVRMYKAIFVFGGAYQYLLDKLDQADFSSRLVVELPGTCPALCRFDPNGANLLMADTTKMEDLLQKRGVDNSRQNLEGMLFDARAPSGGQALTRIFTRFSPAIYNRWDYDKSSGRYLRHSDAENDLSGTNEVYSKLTDKLTGEPIEADNLVVVLAPYFRADPNPLAEVLDVKLSGSGSAYLFRDGQMYRLRWKRAKTDVVLSLVGEDGTPFPFKPGNTWFEVMGASSKIAPGTGSIRFTHAFP